MALHDNNLSLKSYIGLNSNLEESLKKSLDIFLFNTLDIYFKDNEVSQMLGELSRSDFERYTKHNFRSIISALAFDDKKFLNEAFEFIYRVYIFRGADINLMLPLYNAALKSSIKLFTQADIKEISRVFEYLKNIHEELIEKAKIPKVAIKKENRFFKEQTKLYALVLDAKIDDAEKFSYELIVEYGLDTFIYDIIRVVMMQVGFDWEVNKLTYAKEHLITSIFENIIEQFVADKSPKFSQKDLIMVLTTPHEHHSSGADTFTKFLKSQGYNAYLLKGQRNINAIVSQISLSNPKIVAISVTLPTNLYEVSEVIYEVKSKLIGLDIKFMVGGQALNYFYEPVILIGADAYVNSPTEACEMIDTWLKESDG